MNLCAKLALALLSLLVALPALAREPSSRLRERVRAGVRGAGHRPCVVIDLDNTVADTRYRTRAAAELFARRHPEASRLARLPIGRVGWNGRLTALAAGLDGGSAEKFHGYWERFFWNPHAFRFDRPMRNAISLARTARRAGAEVFYLTGRIEALHEGSLRELRRLGLPGVDDAHLLCKSSVEENTLEFKRRSLQALRASGRQLAWFISDSAAEINAVLDLVPCLAVDFPVRAPGSPSLRTSIARLRYGRR